MPELQQLQELQAAIRNAARENQPVFAQAQELYSTFPELVAPVSEQWVVEKLAALIARERATLRRADDRQMQLEGLLGIERLPRRIGPPGESVPRAKATITDLRKEVVRLRRGRAVEDVLRAIDLMKPYVKPRRGDETPITWGEVVEREAAKARHKRPQT